MCGSKYFKLVGLVLGLSAFGTLEAGIALAECCQLDYQEFKTEAACQEMRQELLRSFEQENYSNYYVAECSQTPGANPNYYTWAIAQ